MFSRFLPNVAGLPARYRQVEVGLLLTSRTSRANRAVA